MTAFKDLRAGADNFGFANADDDRPTFLRQRQRIRRQIGPRRGGPAGPMALPEASLAMLSGHGSRRLRQRGIALAQVLTVIDFGNEQRSHGASRSFLDRRARERLAVDMPEALRCLPTLDIQVVLADDGTLVTAAHRTRRLRRDIQARWPRAPD